MVAMEHNNANADKIVYIFAKIANYHFIAPKIVILRILTIIV